MRYLSFLPPESSEPRLGTLVGENVVVALNHAEDHAQDMLDFIQAGHTRWGQVENLVTNLDPYHNAHTAWKLDDVTILPPIPNPPTLRDFYAFEEHVATAHANRGKKVPPEWYEIPVFYFSNPHATYGHGAPVPIPKYSQALDYELEVAAVIGREGRDIPAEEAIDYVFGFTIFNDWSARDVQRQEMKVGLGPAKGKDFASSFGPCIVTPDELADRSDGRPGVYDLEMVARLNGEERSRGNWGTLHHSFGDMIARASADVTLHPGDILGSGTVGTGCLLELTKGQGPWLKKGDVVELEVERVGILRNEIS